MHRVTRLLLVALFVVGSVTLLSGPALAACHVAAFSPPAYTVDEGGGTVTLTVVLQGAQPACEGTVDYATVDGSATAGSDFVAATGTLTFVAGDDRQETISVPITDDTDVEGDESFTVALSNTTGTIASTGSPAQVTITDNDEAPETESPTASETTEPVVTEEPDEPDVSDEPAEPTDEPVPSSSTLPDEIAEPDAQSTVQEVPLEDTDGGSNAPIFIAVLVVAAGSGIAYGFYRKRGEAA